MDETKSVIIVDNALPLGIMANAIAFLSVTLGQRVENRIGPDVMDSTGSMHAGVPEYVLPILQASRGELAGLRDTASHVDDLLTIDFSNAAQSSGTYAEYAEKLAQLPKADLYFLGVALHGPRKIVNKLTRHLQLLR